jgi:RHS repeat-associated protein
MGGEGTTSGTQSGEAYKAIPLVLPMPRELYYYHPDYLGNVEYITDMDGEPYQYFLYTPWGEALKDEQTATGIWDSPYQFNLPCRQAGGKELDEETRLYYYGARYYNPQVSVWLAVDPLHAKSPNQTPYHFVSNNPIMRIDPDGLTDFENSTTGDVVTVNDGMNQIVKVDNKHWQTAVGYSKNEKGNSPSSAYNTFIADNGGVAVPTENDGGMIPDKEMLLGFLEFKANNEKKEVAALAVENGNGDNDYVVGPWKDNTSESSQISKSEVTKYGYSENNVKAQIHNHPGSPGNSSYRDARSSTLYNILIFSIGSKGDIWLAKQSVYISTLDLEGLQPSGFNWGKRVNKKQVP